MKKWGEIGEKLGRKGEKVEEIRKVAEKGGERGRKGELYYAQRSSVLTNSFCNISPFSK